MQRRIWSVLTALFLGACGRRPDVPTAPPVPFTPSEPSPAPPPAKVNGANWSADATVLSVVNSGHACGWGTAPNQTRSGVQWRIAMTGDSISLDEDMPNWP